MKKKSLKNIVANAFFAFLLTLAGGCEMKRNAKIFVIGYHEGGINDLKISSDSKSVYTSACDNTLKEWDIFSGIAIERCKNVDKLKMDISISMKRMLLDIPCFRFDIDKSKNELLFDRLQIVDLEKGGFNLLYSYDEASTPLEFNNAIYEEMKKNPDVWSEPFLQSLIYSGKQNYIAACSGVDDNFVVKLWEKSNTKPKWRNETEKWVYGLAFSPNEKYLIGVCWDSDIYVWDVLSGQCVNDLATSWPDWNFTHDNTCFFTVEFSPNGALFATGSADENGGRFRLFDAEKRKMLFEEKGCLITHNESNEAVSEIHDLKFSPDGSIVATGGSDQILRFWSINDHNNIQINDSVDFSIYGIMKELYRKERRSFFTHRFQWQFLPGTINAIDFARDGTFVVVGLECGLVLRIALSIR